MIIAKQIKPYTIGKTLVKPCALKIAEIVFAQESEKELRKISFSDITVQRRISDLANDIKQQGISNIKNAQFGLFSVQLDERADVSACSQLMVPARWRSG